jgi:hypothetical protein
MQKLPKSAHSRFVVSPYQCERGESNPHGFPHWILSLKHCRFRFDDGLRIRLVSSILDCTSSTIRAKLRLALSTKTTPCD